METSGCVHVILSDARMEDSLFGQCVQSKLEFYNRFAGRAALLEYAAQMQIPVQQTAAKPWSTGA